MDRSFEPGPITRRIILSALVGIGGAAAFISFNSPASFTFFPSLLALALIFSSPLVIISILVGVIYRESIKNNLLSWSFIAPLSVWAFMCIVKSTLGANSFSPEFNVFDQLLITSTNLVNLLFLFSPMVSSLAFFLLSRWKICFVFNRANAS